MLGGSLAGGGRGWVRLLGSGSGLRFAGRCAEQRRCRASSGRRGCIHWILADFRAVMTYLNITLTVLCVQDVFLYQHFLMLMLTNVNGSPVENPLGHHGDVAVICSY